MRNQLEDGPGHLETALFSERVVAFALDIVLFIGLFLAALKAVAPEEAIATHSKGFVMAWMFIGFFILYHAFMSSEGRVSLGKRLVGIRIVDMHGHPLGVPAALLRSLAYLLSGIGSLGFLWGLLNKSRQGWHDILAGSVVVSSRRNAPAVQRLVLAGSWLTAALLAVIYTWEVAVATPYYRIRTVAASQVGLEEIGRLERLHKGFYGHYTPKLSRLANLSGDPARFMQNMNDLFAKDPGLKITVTPKSFTVEGRSIHRDRALVRLVGP